MLALDLRQHHRDGLRVFVLQVVGEHRLVDVRQLVPHRTAGRTTDILHDLVDFVVVQHLHQQPFGAFIGADQRAGGGDLLGELDEQPLDDGGTDRAQVGHGLRQLADFLVVHVGEELGGVLLPQRQHHDGGFFRTGEGAVIFAYAQRCHGSSSPVHRFMFPGRASFG